MNARCGNDTSHPGHPIWINGGAHPPIQCPGMEDVKSIPTDVCKDGVFAGERHVACEVEGEHDAHVGHLGSQRVEWSGPIGRTKISPPELVM